MPLLSRAQRHRDNPRTASPAQGQANRRAAALPTYEPPAFPLDNFSLRALTELSNGADTRRYEEQLKQSITLLTNNVRDINDRFVKRKGELGRLQKRHASASQNDDDEEGEKTEARKRLRAEEATVERLRDAVPELTAECESAVRDIIDLRVGLEDGRKAIQDTVRRCETEQRRANAPDGDQNRGNRDDEDDYVMGDAKPQLLGPRKILKNEQEKAAADYATRSMEQRYSVDNDYVGFKRLWWDSVHGVDGKPLPDASRWFADNGEDDEEEEDDLVIAEEHISIHCPLSLVIMEEPYTSNVCKHTFNKPAIVQFLRSQPGRRAKCPQTGCSKEISIKDFYDDPVVLRKVRRALAEKERQDADEEDEDGDEDGEEEGDSSIMQPSGVKAEAARDRGNQLIADLVGN
ncbi:zinc-finger of the MIZ type in Nse subunit-domain-containing protein [Nemania sp. FL0916]|nr:zinc-finger of the MIZ type in Nse subunit-domain-containing protein [Nemania sp. FL0916]